MEILHLITARGGSRSIPRKNLAEIGGLSLVGYKARSALKSHCCSRLIISSDCPEIRAEAVRQGAEAPFARPAELASDTASSMAAVAHALDWVEQHEGRTYDAFMLLEPSSPFGRADDYDRAAERMVNTGANVVVGMRPMEVHSTYTGTLEPDGNIASIVDRMKARADRRRQATEVEYTMNGAFYLCRWAHFKKHLDFYASSEGVFGLAMESEYSVEIDEPIDLAWARFLVDNRVLDGRHWDLPESSSH
jgi:CMP-N,N'-diacetyllegionaminic acid synthase